MDTPLILVVDGDSKNLTILRESLEASGFKVNTADNGNDAWLSIQAERPDIIVSEVDIPGIGGFQLMEKLQKDPSCATIPLVFLTNRRNFEDKIKSLRTGVKDFMIKPLHVKEVIARLKMILRRIERIRNEEAETNRKIIGRLEENSVENLVENYGVERRTGVLSLYDENNRNGEIYFRDGTVVNARLGNFKAEKAVYQMLPWTRGRFVMTLKDINVDDEITVSNLGLLLQGVHRLQARDQITKRLPPGDTIFVKTTLFKQILSKKKTSSDAARFIALLDGSRTLRDIVRESVYDDLKTLERVLKLYEQGFIRRVEEPEQAIAMPSPPDKPERAVAPPVESEPEPDPFDFKIQESDEADERKQSPFDYEGLQAKSDKYSPEEIAEFPAEQDESQVPELEKPDAPDLPHPFYEAPPDANANIRKHPLLDLDDDAKSEGFGYKDKINGSPPAQKTEPDESKLNPDISEPESDDDDHEIPTPFASLGASNGSQHASGDQTIPESLEKELIALLKQTGRRSGKVAIISPNHKARNDLMGRLTGDKYAERIVGNDERLAFEVGKIQSEDSRLDILCFPAEMPFLEMLREYSSTLLGCALVLDDSETNRASYWSYFIKSLRDYLELPWVTAIIGQKSPTSAPLEYIRYSLKLNDSDELMALNPGDADRYFDCSKSRLAAKSSRRGLESFGINSV